MGTTGLSHYFVNERPRILVATLPWISTHPGASYRPAKNVVHGHMDVITDVNRRSQASVFYSRCVFPAASRAVSMLHCRKRRAISKWARILRPGLRCFVHRAGIFSLITLLLAFSSISEDKDHSLPAQKHTVSSPPLQIFLTTSDDQLERTNDLVKQWQVTHIGLFSLRPTPFVCCSRDWPLQHHDYTTLARVFTTRQDRSPPRFR